MKYLFYIITTILLIQLYSCGNTEEPPFTNVYVMIDITGSNELLQSENIFENSIDEILETIGVSTQKGAGVSYNGGEVKIFLINDLSNSKSKTVILNKGKSGAFGQNPLDRMDEIKAFEKDLRITFDKISKNITWDKPQSKIYQNVCREMNKIVNESKENPKYFIIFSDMIENSQLFSFYKKNSINVVMKDVSTFEAEYLTKDCTIPDLSEVNIYIIQTRNMQNDELINLSEKFWGELFKLKNAAKVEFDSELDI